MMSVLCNYFLMPVSPNLEQGIVLRSIFNLVSSFLVLACVGVLFTRRERQAAIRASCQELVEIVLLLLVPTDLDEPPSHLHQEDEATGKILV